MRKECSHNLDLDSMTFGNRIRDSNSRTFLQSCPSGRETQFADIKLKVLTEYKLLIIKCNYSMSAKTCPRPCTDGPPCVLYNQITALYRVSIPSFTRFHHVLFWEFPCPAWAVASCRSSPQAGELPKTYPNKVRT